jgi:hypothetical protein
MSCVLDAFARGDIQLRAGLRIVAGGIGLWFGDIVRAELCTAFGTELDVGTWPQAASTAATMYENLRI